MMYKVGKNCRFLYGIAALLLCSYTAVAQNPALTLANHAYDLSATNPKEGLRIGNQVIAQAGKDSEATASALNAKGMCWYRLGNADSAEQAFNAAIANYRSRHRQSGEGRVTLNLSSLYTERAQYEKALSCLLYAGTLFDGANDASGKACTEKLIGILYRQQGRYTEAITHLKKAIAGFKAINDPTVADAIESLGNVYTRTAQYDTATKCYRTALGLYTSEKNVSGMAFACENMGDVFMNQTNDHYNALEDSALVYYQKAYSYFTALGSQANVSYEKLKIARILLDKGGDARAIPYLKEALTSFNTNKDYAYAVDALGLLHKAMATQGKYMDAYRYSLQELYYKDTLSSNNRKEVVTSMLAKYEVDRRDRTIALLHAQEKLTDEQLHHSHVMDIIYSVLAVIAVVLVFMFFNIYRVRQRLKEVEMRNRIAGDLHDEVGSSLSSILLLSKMALNHNSNQAIQQQLLGTIKGNAEEVIDRMSDIVWTTDPKFDEGSSLRARMENFLAQVRQSTGLLVHADLDDELVNAAYPMDMRKNMFLIFKEAVNNVAKHAQATGLTVQLRKTESEMILSITDNGKGITPGEKPAGKGLESMQQRAALLGGTLTIGHAGTTTGGTSIILHIPLHRRNHTTTKKQTHG